jgi:hypothetical protein
MGTLLFGETVDLGGIARHAHSVPIRAVPR